MGQGESENGMVYWVFSHSGMRKVKIRTNHEKREEAINENYFERKKNGQGMVIYWIRGSRTELSHR